MRACVCVVSRCGDSRRCREGALLRAAREGEPRLDAALRGRERRGDGCVAPRHVGVRGRARTALPPPRRRSRDSHGADQAAPSVAQWLLLRARVLHHKILDTARAVRPRPLPPLLAARAVRVRARCIRVCISRVDRPVAYITAIRQLTACRYQCSLMVNTWIGVGSLYITIIIIFQAAMSQVREAAAGTLVLI